MHIFHKVLSVLALTAAVSFATEVFGGIGVTIYGTPDGVHVVEVIPGGPAALVGILPGDRITAIDQVSLKGLSQDQCVEKLRGIPARPLEATVIRDGESLSMVMRRVQLTIEDIDPTALSNWYGKDRKEFNAEEIKVFAEAKVVQNTSLLGVMRRGQLISSAMKTPSDDIVGVFVDKEQVFDAPAVTKSQKAASSSLKSFNRKLIAFELLTEGPASLKILDANGELISSIEHQKGLAGINTVSWDGSKMPSGRYLVRIEQNGSVSGLFAVLR